MNLLADFTNFQYMLPQIKGVVIHMEDKKTFINFPKNRYDEVSVTVKIGTQLNGLIAKFNNLYNQAVISSTHLKIIRHCSWFKIKQNLITWVNK